MKITSKTKKVATMLRSAGDESRLKILCALFSDANACVSDIATKLGMSVAITSHHLRSLSKSGLVVPVRRGKHTCYRLTDTHLVSDLKNFICKYK